MYSCKSTFLKKVLSFLRVVRLYFSNTRCHPKATAAATARVLPMVDSRGIDSI